MALQAKAPAKAKPLSKEKLAELKETKAQQASIEEPAQETVAEEAPVTVVEETQKDDVPFWMVPGYDWYNDKRWEQYEEAREYWLIHLT